MLFWPFLPPKCLFLRDNNNRKENAPNLWRFKFFRSNILIRILKLIFHCTIIHAMRCFSAPESKCVVSAWLGIKSHSAGALQWWIEVTVWMLYIPILLHRTSIRVRQLIHISCDGTKSPHTLFWVSKGTCHGVWWEIYLCQVPCLLGRRVCLTDGIGGKYKA